MINCSAKNLPPPPPPSFVLAGTLHAYSAEINISYWFWFWCIFLQGRTHHTGCCIFQVSFLCFYAQVIRKEVTAMMLAYVEGMV